MIALLPGLFIRNTLLPRVRSKVKADPSTGYISNTTISSWDALVKSALESMVNSEDIADFDIYINSALGPPGRNAFQEILEFSLDSPPLGG